jgi:hypothetical protein
MATRLEWDKRKRQKLVARSDVAWLDGVEVGRIRRWGVGDWGYTVRIGETEVDAFTKELATMSADKARAGCAAAARRLLADAGVGVE